MRHSCARVAVHAILASLVLLAAAPLAAHAVVIFSDFGPGDSFDHNIGWTIGLSGFNFPSAMPFSVSGGSYNLGSIALAVSWVQGPNQLQVKLADDAGGAPGSILEDFAFVDAMGKFGTAVPLLEANSLAHPLLQDGHTYWLEAGVPTSDTWAAWNWNTVGVVGGSQMSDASPWKWDGSSSTGAFRISTDPVPEPSAGLLLLAGLGALGALAASRRNR